MDYKKGNLAKEVEDPFYLKDPVLADLFEKCKPPKEAYFYFPKGEEIIVMNRKRPQNSYRKLYYDVLYYDYEKEEINKLKEIINQHPEIKLPDFFDDELLLRFLYADDCELDKVFKRLVKYIEWSNKTFPLVIQPKSKIIEILNKGIFYVYGRDCKFRPLLILRLVEFIKYEKIYSVEEVIMASCFLGQFIINHMFLPGHVERWDMIINLRKVTLFSLPNHIKKLLPVLNEAFISRLNKTYVIGMNIFFRLLYKIICAFLHESTVKKIKILEGKNDQSLFEEIRRDNIEIDMGGTAPNARIGEESVIFPPRMPSEHFLLENQRSEDILISEEEYIKKYKNQEIHKDLVYPLMLSKINEEEKVIEKQINLSIRNDIKEQVNQQKQSLENKQTNKIIFNKKKEINNFLIKKRREIFVEKQKLFFKKQHLIQKVKIFTNINWEVNEEFIISEKYNIDLKRKNPLKKGNNIINEIKALTNKRKFFNSNISKISNTKI